jgi:hypothetical protein
VGVKIKIGCTGPVYLGDAIVEWAPDVPHLATRADMVEAYGEAVVQAWEERANYFGRPIRWEGK